MRCGSSRATAPTTTFRTSRGSHWVETDWRNYRRRHFVRALERVEAGWAEWRRSFADPGQMRESVRGLTRTRPYDLGRHTHSALMLASGMSLQRLARIQGHSIRVLDEAYSEEIAEFQERAGRIDPTEEIEAARRLVWGASTQYRRLTATFAFRCTFVPATRSGAVFCPLWWQHGGDEGTLDR